MPALNPLDYAIVVGINDYDDPAIDSLQGCVEDVRMFVAWLSDPIGGGLEANNIKTVCSIVPRANPIQRPVKDEVEDQIVALIKRHFSNGQRVGRRLYLWFSGHGITPTKDDQECALLMANASLIALGRSVPGRKAAEVFRKRAMFEEVVLFMDCCRGAAGLEEATFTFDDAADPTIAPNVRWLHGFATKWAAASAERLLPHPLDLAQPQSHHGVFTHAVLEGLRKGVNDVGEVTSESLARYVKERTQQLLPPDDNQRPDFRFDSDRQIVFGVGQKIPVQVTLTNPANGFQVRDGGNIGRVIQSIPVAAANPTQIGLAPGIYLFGAPATGNNFSISRFVTVLGDPLHVVL